MIKKTLSLFIVLIFFIGSTNLLQAKTCGCTEGKLSYRWYVPDRSACSSATYGNAVKTLDGIESLVAVSVAVNFCG